MWPFRKRPAPPAPKAWFVAAYDGKVIDDPSRKPVHPDVDLKHRRGFQ